MAGSAFAAGFDAGFGAGHGRRMALLVTSPYHDGHGGVTYEPGVIVELAALPGLPATLMVTDVIVDSALGVVARGSVMPVFVRAAL